MGLNEPVLKSRGKSKSTPTVNVSSPNTGPASSGTETSGPLTGQLFPEWTCSAVDSHAKTLALPESEPGSTGSAAACGVNTSEPFAHFDHDSLLWRTSQVCLLTNTWDVFSETWSRAGTMRNGIVYQQVPLVPLTGEIGYGLWPTPQAQMPGAGPNSPKVKNLLTGNRHSFYLTQAVEAERQKPGVITGMWPTPTANRRDGLQSHGVNVISGSLNPNWVEGLMGYPIGWTDLPED